MPVEAVVFDWDGTFARESIAKIVVPVYHTQLSFFGISFPLNDYQRVAGLSTIETIKAIAKLCGIELPLMTVVDLARRVEINYHACMSTMDDLTPYYLRETLEGLREDNNNIKVGIATSAPTEAVWDALKRWKYLTLVAQVAGKEDSLRIPPKPAPDVYHLIAQRLKVNPRDVLAVEDTPVGVQAAIAAGMRVVGVRTAVPDKELLMAGAYEIVQDVSHINVNYLAEFNRRFPPRPPR